MRRAMRFAAALFGTGLLLSAVPARAVDAVNTGFFGNTAIKGFDPVAYFHMNEPVKGSSEYTHEWMGAVWHFASAENRDTFAANPERYAPQYGGYCAYAVSQGATANIDPNAFSIVEDKLYLNLSPEIRKRWAADRERYIAQADVNWPKLRVE